MVDEHRRVQGRTSRKPERKSEVQDSKQRLGDPLGDSQNRNQRRNEYVQSTMFGRRSLFNTTRATSISVTPAPRRLCTKGVGPISAPTQQVASSPLREHRGEETGDDVAPRQ